MDIRIVEERHEQPTLFGPLLVSLVYRLADWDTYEPLNEIRYPTMGEAEKATRDMLLAIGLLTRSRTMKLEDRFLVLKRADIEAALTPYELHIFQRMVACVGEYRASQGKSENAYVVINQDESYFPDVLKLMEGHEIMKGL